MKAIEKKLRQSIAMMNIKLHRQYDVLHMDMCCYTDKEPSDEFLHCIECSLSVMQEYVYRMQSFKRVIKNFEKLAAGEEVSEDEIE